MLVSLNHIILSTESWIFERCFCLFAVDIYGTALKCTNVSTYRESSIHSFVSCLFDHLRIPNHSNIQTAQNYDDDDDNDGDFFWSVQSFSGVGHHAWVTAYSYRFVYKPVTVNTETINMVLLPISKNWTVNSELSRWCNCQFVRAFVLFP